MYSPPLPANLQDLRRRNKVAVASSDILNKVEVEIAYRLVVCHVTNGAHMKHLSACSKVSTTHSKLNAQTGHAQESKQSCAKEKKIPNLNESFSSSGDSVGLINAIMNFNILAFVFKNEVHCKMCNGVLDIQVLRGKSGLAIKFVLKCFACPYRAEFSTSNFHEGTQIATINTRFVYAMRSIGRGAETGRMFCGIMNLPQKSHKVFSLR
ncbi:uncharacterized protein TNCV_4849691 [Trichonephila clavipes]|nr:uncharacterized protein TNCV_4849691 [Trichonephila clavipes]